jgi:ATP-dependent protease HslVU (ClpYQ) ATPase subunit
VREIFISLDKMLANRQGKLEKREMKVSEARPLLEDIESQRVISDETVCLLICF